MERAGVAVDDQAALVRDAPQPRDHRRDHRRGDDDEDAWPVAPEQTPHRDRVDRVADRQQCLLLGPAADVPGPPTQRLGQGLGTSLVVVPRHSSDRDRRRVIHIQTRFTLGPGRAAKNGRSRTLWAGHPWAQRPLSLSGAELVRADRQQAPPSRGAPNESARRELVDCSEPGANRGTRRPDCPSAQEVYVRGRRIPDHHASPRGSTPAAVVAPTRALGRSSISARTTSW